MIDGREHALSSKKIDVKKAKVKMSDQVLKKKRFNVNIPCGPKVFLGILHLNVHSLNLEHE